jgi:hypothetical protein
MLDLFQTVGMPSFAIVRSFTESGPGSMS